MTGLRKVSAGEAFNPSATTWNAFVDAAVYAKSQRKGRTQIVTSGIEWPATTVLVQNNTGSDLDALSVGGIDSPIITPTDNEDEFKTRIGWNIETPAAVHFGNFVVLAEAIPDGELGLAYAGGMCPVMITTEYDDFGRADINAGSTVKLLAGLHGSAQIVWKEAGTGTDLLAVIKFDTPREVSVLGVTNEAITADDSGGVSVWIGGSDTGYDLDVCYLDWMHGGEAISSGKEVIVKYFPLDFKWRIIHAECE